MVKKAPVLGLLFCMISCFYSRTEYGNIRFKPSRFKIKPNSNNEVYKIIDTTKLYELIDVISRPNDTKLVSFKKTYLKFYAKGRVGQFDHYLTSDNNSLNPKKSKMAYYNYGGENLFIQIYFENAQGGGLITNRFYQLNNNNLELINEYYLDIYKIIDLPEEFLIYKPDW